MEGQPIDGREFRGRLIAFRNAKGLMQEELSEEIGRASNYISRVETGRIKTVPPNNLAKLADTLDVPIEELRFVKGLTDPPEKIKKRILDLLETADPQKLRKYYRLLLVVIEE